MAPTLRGGIKSGSLAYILSALHAIYVCGVKFKLLIRKRSAAWVIVMALGSWQLPPTFRCRTLGAEFHAFLEVLIYIYIENFDVQHRSRLEMECVCVHSYAQKKRDFIFQGY
jgi:hypothetical protein